MATLKEVQFKQWSEIIEQLKFIRENEESSMSSSGLKALEEIQGKLESQKRELETRYRLSTVSTSKEAEQGQQKTEDAQACIVAAKEGPQ